MSFNPKAYFIDEGMQDLQNKDMYIMSLLSADIYIYVEDKGCGGLYEILFEKIYPDKTVKIFDFYTGKTSVINRYEEIKKSKKLSSQMYFLLDRDYEDKFESRKYATLSNYSFKELKENSNFRIWKKTNVENYLISERTLITKAFRSRTGKKIEEFEDILTEEIYSKIKKVFKETSTVYMLSHLFDGCFRKSRPHLKMPCFGFTDDYSIMLRDLERHILSKKHLYSEEIQEVEKKGFCEILEEIRSRFDEETDIDGKQMLKAIVHFIKNDVHGCNNITDDSIKGAIISTLSSEQLNEMKAELNLN